MCREQNQSKIVLSTAVFKIVKSLARLTIRHGMSIGAVTELVRRAYLEAAQDLLTQEQSRITTSQICAMTGMYRKEVRRLEQLPEISDAEADDKYNRSARVITGWLQDPDYTTRSGRPAALKPEGDISFESLVKKYSGDMSPRAMRRELERLGTVSISTRGLLKLETAAYLNAGETDGIQVLGTDTVELIDTISHNLKADPDKRRFQRKVSFTGVPAGKTEDFYRYAEAESQKLLEKLNRWLANVSDTTPDSANNKVSVGIYHFDEPDYHTAASAEQQTPVRAPG